MTGELRPARGGQVVGITQGSRIDKNPIGVNMIGEKTWSCSCEENNKQPMTAAFCDECGSTRPAPRPRIELVCDAAAEFSAELILAVESGYEIEMLMEDAIKLFEPEQRAAFILQCFSPEPDAMTVDDKVFAAHVADHFGPEWAQKLYRFAVLVTKTA